MLTRLGPPAQLTREVVLRRQPVFTTETFAELSDRLWRPRFDRYVSLEQRRRLLTDLDAVALWVEVPGEIAERTFCRDAGDDKFIHAALAAGAACLVTGDQDLLVLAGSLAPQGLRVLTPAAALQELAPAAPRPRPFDRRPLRGPSIPPPPRPLRPPAPAPAPHPPPAAARGRRAPPRRRVRDQQAGRAGLAHLGDEYCQHALGGLGVEVAGGFVGQDQPPARAPPRARWPRAATARPRAARQRAPSPPRPTAASRPRRVRRRAAPAGAAAAPRSRPRSGAAARGRPGRRSRGAAGAAARVRLRRAWPGRRRRCGRCRGRRVEPGDAVQQRRLAHTRFAEQRDELAGRSSSETSWNTGVSPKDLASPWICSIGADHAAPAGRRAAPAEHAASHRGHRRAPRARHVPRSQVSWRLASCRVAAMPASRRPRARRLSSAAQACR
jgi:uncharacterized protein